MDQDLPRDTMMHSGLTWGETLDLQADARDLLDSLHIPRDYAPVSFETLVSLIVARTTLVKKLAKLNHGTRAWQDLSKGIVEIEALLAPHGLV